MAEFIDCAAVVLPFFAIIAAVTGHDEALELSALAAVALGLALGRRWWDGR
jgi:hypothetical protein